MKQYIILLLVLIVGLSLSFTKKYYEGYSNYHLDQASGTILESNSLLVQDSFPVIGKGTISNNSSNTIWNDYPIFTLGSYDQITNNIKYPHNPDEGTCMPASMCGALYHKNNNTPHETSCMPLNDITRVGFFNTGTNPFI